MNIELSVNDMVVIVRALEKVDPTFLFTTELQRKLRQVIDDEAKQQQGASVGQLG